MVVESGEEENGGDPATPSSSGDHLSWSCSIDGASLLLDTLRVFFKDRQPFFHASSQLHGQLGRQVAVHEGGLEGQGEGGPVMRAVGSKVWGWGVCEYGVRLLPGTLWVFLTDWLLGFRASFQPHGHFGRQSADHRGELGRQGEAVPVGEVGGQQGVGVGGVWVWCYGWLLLVQHSPLGSDLTRLPSFSTNLGHSGSQVGDEAVGWVCEMVEGIHGASVSAEGVGYSGVRGG